MQGSGERVLVTERAGFDPVSPAAVHWRTRAHGRRISIARYFLHTIPGVVGYDTLSLRDACFATVSAGPGRPEVCVGRSLGERAPLLLPVWANHHAV